MKCRSITLAALTAGACLAAPAAAQADSIVFTRGGDVFLTTPDGSREHRVTSNGGWSEVTQADDGTIVATKNGSFHRMDQSGTELNAPFRVESLNRSGSVDPFFIRVSPDGKRVAFYASGDVRFTDSDKPSPPDAYAWPTGSFPSWLDNERVVFVNTCLYTTGFAAGSGGSFSYCDHEDHRRPMGPAEMTRALDKLVVVRGAESKELRFYSGNGGPPADPTPRCAQPVGSGAVGSPSWSPDGSQLAYSAPEGVQVRPAPDFTTCAQPAGGFSIAGASSPDWGPADVPAAKVDPQPEIPTGGPLQSAKVAKPGRMKAALKKGVKVTITCSAACSAKGDLRFKGKIVAKGSKKLTGAGKGALVLKFTAKGKKTLAKSRKAKLALAVSATDEQGRSSQTTGSVSLKR